jgi:hypothetical protein
MNYKTVCGYRGIFEIMEMHAKFQISDILLGSETFVLASH